MKITPRPLPAGSTLICIEPTKPVTPWPGPILWISLDRAKRWMTEGPSSFAIRARAEGCRVQSGEGETKTLCRQVRTLLQPSTCAQMASIALDLGLPRLARAFQAQTLAADAKLSDLLQVLRHAELQPAEQKSTQILAALEVL